MSCFTPFLYMPEFYLLFSVYTGTLIPEEPFIFEKHGDAERFYKALSKRLERFGLQLHKDKSQLIRTGHQAATELAVQGQRLKTFKFLGFICYFAKSKNGYWVPKYRSS